jgi:hypothetical protein
MAQRQFRSDDTSIWATKFGSGASGTKTYTTTHTLDSGDGYYNGTLTGSASATTATTNISAATYNLPCIIHQTQGTGVGNWELNFLTIISGTTATFTYPLINTYGTGAQIATINPYSAVTINSGVILSPSTWNGSTGGILFLIVNGALTITGDLSASAKGYRGGTGTRTGSPTQWGISGEGESSGPTAKGSNTNNGAGAGAGNYDGGNRTSGGGGGSNAAVGSTGGSAGGGGGSYSAATGGTGGQTILGNASLTSATLGGGGGNSIYASSSNSGSIDGGAGGGLILIIARNIVVSGTISVNGGNGISGVSTTSGSSGAGAGGDILLKGQSITLGSSLVTASGGTGGSFSDSLTGIGGNGSVGRIHADYLISPSGTTSPTIDTRQDLSLADTSGSFLFNFL